MNLSKRTKYALQALQELAKHPVSQPVLISDLARARAIPQKFLEAILLDLKHAGIVASRKGKGGGYFLARSPHEIKVGEVVRLLEGMLAPIACVSHKAFQPCVECGPVQQCALRTLMAEVRDSVARLLDGTSLAELNRREDALRTGIIPEDWVI